MEPRIITAVFAHGDPTSFTDARADLALSAPPCGDQAGTALARDFSAKPGAPPSSRGPVLARTLTSPAYFEVKRLSGWRRSLSRAWLAGGLLVCTLLLMKAWSGTTSR